MPCRHLQPLEDAIRAHGIAETWRGKAWSKVPAEWVYYDCVIDLEQTRRQITLDACVIEHMHRGTHDGAEMGFECNVCGNGVMGVHPAFGQRGTARFP